MFEPDKTAFNVENRAITNGLLTNFDEKLVSHHIGISTYNLRRHSITIEETPPASGFEGHVEYISKGEFKIFLPDGLNSKETDPTVVEELTHAVQVAENPHLQSMLIEIDRLQQDIVPYAHIDDSSMLMAQILLNRGQTRQIVDHVLEKAKMLNLKFSFNRAKYFSDSFIEKIEPSGEIIETKRDLHFTQSMPGVILRIYETQFGQDETSKPLRQLLKKYYTAFQKEGEWGVETQDLYKSIYNCDEYGIIQGRVAGLAESLSADSHEFRFNPLNKLIVF